MARRPEWTIFALLAGALAAAALLGRAVAPNPALTDQRRSALLAGPAGAKGLAETLRRLGTPVVAWRRPLAEVDSGPPSRLVALLDPPGYLPAADLPVLQLHIIYRKLDEK